MRDAQAISFVTHGCKVNQAESATIARRLAEAGTPATTIGPSDVVVINTCTVTAEADHKARKAIRRALGGSSDTNVVVTGCLAAIDPESLRALGDRVIVEPDKARVAERVRALAGEGGQPLTGAVNEERARVAVKVQDGCDAYCAYCIVPYARGASRSGNADEVAAEVARVHAQGTREVVLTGVNLGKYRDDGVDLPKLLEAVAATGVARIRLSSIEPEDLTEKLLEVAATVPSFCAHLHVPLQSGSDAVLARMGRRYDTAVFSERVAACRRAFPSVTLTTDVIVGFPGETEAEFAETCAFVREIGFGDLHVFRYSARGGTAAALMDDQLPSPVRAQRAETLRALAGTLRAESRRRWVGKRCELLVERVSGSGPSAVAEGTTREYVKVRLSAPDVRPGSLVTVTISAGDGSWMTGAW